MSPLGQGSGRVPGWFPLLCAESSSFTAVGLMTGPDFVNSVFIFPPPAVGRSANWGKTLGPKSLVLLGNRLRLSLMHPISAHTSWAVAFPGWG